MSLRQRLALVVCLAVIAAMTAGAAVWQLARDSDSARAKAAAASTDAAAEALARRYRVDAEDAPLTPGDVATEARLRRVARAVIASLIDGAGGYCTKDGLMVSEGGPQARSPGRGWRGRRPPPPDALPPDAPPPFGRPPGPPPEVRELLLRACAAAQPGRVDHDTVAHPTHPLVVSVVGVDDGVASWALTRTQRSELGRPWAVLLLAMAIVTAAMVIVTLDAMVALTRGAGELEDTVRRLEADLTAPVAEPRAKELARISRGLRELAAHLAEAQARERALARQVSDGARLAALGRLVAGVAHEIRNPLTGLKLKLDVMAKRPLDDRSSRDLETCLREAARIDRVISSVLGVARRGAEAAEELDVATLVSERVEAAGELAASRGVSLGTRGLARIVAARELLARALDNLLRNAIEASPTGSRVEVEIRELEGGAELAVVDEGPGVDEARAAELFEPFFSTKPGGTGLGLWMTRALVEARGGRLEYARAGGRTRFTLCMPHTPVARPEAHDADAADRR